MISIRVTSWHLVTYRNSFKVRAHQRENITAFLFVGSLHPTSIEVDAYLDKDPQDVKTHVSVSAEATELSNDDDNNNT